MLICCSIPYDDHRLCIGIFDGESSVDLLNMSLYTLLPIILSNWAHTHTKKNELIAPNVNKHLTFIDTQPARKHTAPHSLCVYIACACNLYFWSQVFVRLWCVRVCAYERMGKKLWCVFALKSKIENVNARRSSCLSQIICVRVWARALTSSWCLYIHSSVECVTYTDTSSLTRVLCFEIGCTISRLFTPNCRR